MIPTTNREYASRALKCLAIAAVVFGSAHVFQKHWKIAFDGSEHPCLEPHRVFLVEMGEVTPTAGDIVTFRTSGIPLFEDETLFTKKVLGVPGDEVSVTAFGVVVNGVTLQFTDQALNRLTEASVPLMPMQFVRDYVLGPDEYFMYGTNPRSYDSRYYGPIQASQFIGASRALW